MNITLELADEQYKGIEARDFARRFGVAPEDHYWTGQRISDAFTREPECEVDEAFARAWFASDQVESTATVPTVLLTFEDRVTPEKIHCRVTFAELAPERIKELYVAVRFRGLQQQVDRLKTQIVELGGNPEPEEVEVDDDE